jgi:hypothetical protein
VPNGSLGWESYVPNRIVGQRFDNQEILLDGNEYIDCEFHAVTFVYNGTTPLRMSKNRIYASIIYKSKNEAIEAAWGLVIATGQAPNIEVLGPGKGTIDKPQLIPPPHN